MRPRTWISALFSGPSGTGKTMAAEVLANELRLDVYRIDLASVVSKYIGETEKNLRRIFDAAEALAVLFAFYGGRCPVRQAQRGRRDSHDRYANVEISDPLQRMEDYRGLAILTTNMKQWRRYGISTAHSFRGSVPVSGCEAACGNLAEGPSQWHAKGRAGT